MSLIALGVTIAAVLAVKTPTHQKAKLRAEELAARRA
jgi:hypothetical protein